MTDLGPLPAIKYVDNPEIELTPLVCVEMKVPMGSELVKRYHQWFIEHGVWDEGFGSLSGGGRYRGFYTAENAEKVLAWAKEQGFEATRTTSSLWDKLNERHAELEDDLKHADNLQDTTITEVRIEEVERMMDLFRGSEDAH